METILFVSIRRVNLAGPGAVLKTDGGVCSSLEFDSLALRQHAARKVSVSREGTNGPLQKIWSGPSIK